MALRDHFHPPLSVRRPWDSFHTAWTTLIARELNQGLLPRGFVALPQTHFGMRIETDVATLQQRETPSGSGNGLATALWAPPATPFSAIVDFSDQDVYEVRVRDGDERFVAAIELVSPANKDRPEHRRDFAVKCASYLQQRIAVVIVDIVTARQGNLHRELMHLLGQPPHLAEAAATPLYTVGYRVAVRPDDRHQLEFWPQPLGLGAALPTVPLWLTDEVAIPLDLETSYRATLEMFRLDDVA